MLQSNHAIQFDGVSDGVIIPQGFHSKIGQEYDPTDNSRRSSSDIVSVSSQGNKGKSIISDALPTKLCIEAWVVPDCGGVVLQKEGQFELSLGTIDTPGPAIFEANIRGNSGLDKVILRSALPISNGYDGQIYPPSTYGGIDDSFNRFDSGKDDATSLNINQRPLYHIVASLQGGVAKLFINGEIVCKQTIAGEYNLVQNDDHVYIGGKGGEFRGVIEGIHISTSFSEEMTGRSAPLVSAETLCLYRFEEPITPFSTVYDLTATEPHGASSYNDDGLAVAITNLSTITVSPANAQAMANALTGKTITDTYVDFTVTPYSTGNYDVYDNKTTPGTVVSQSIPHVPYNLLINPGAIHKDSKKPNQKPPERVRLHRINITSGEMLVSSIHLDFPNSTAGGLRGLLHTTHITDYGANYFVIISGDFLIDNGTGQPYQPPHLATQLIDRTGQMLIDEGLSEQHAMVYSSRMSTTDKDVNNPFAVAWPSDLDALFQVGHSGRHVLNHVDGHHYLRNMPRANDELLDQQSGNADVLTLMYDETAKGIDKQFPINSLVDYYREIARFDVLKKTNSSFVYEAVDNGLNDPNKKLIAIGGTSGGKTFDTLPFVLKGPVPKSASDVDDNIRKFHLRPSSESRIALLHVPELSADGLAPYVEIHYNAIDWTGVSVSKTTPMLMIEKTVPASNYSLGGGAYVIDRIIASIASGKTLYSPGGYIDVSIAEEGGLEPKNYTHSFIGDNSEGFESDEELDESFTPQNFTPEAGGTQGNITPQNINASHTTKAEHDSVFNRLLIERVESTASLSQIKTARKDPYTESGSGDGQFDIALTSGASPIHEVFDIIDNRALLYEGDAVHRFFIQPSDRRRTNQLQYLRTRNEREDGSNRVNLFHIMTRARLRSIAEVEGEEGGRYTVVNCVGLSDVALTRSVNEIGSGSPDSHVVKEIDPNAPVVSVTLGGIGQGAYDTKPSFDPSPLARLPYTTRRGFACLGTAVRIDLSVSPVPMQYIQVLPLNNNSPDLENWGTYPFPSIGRIYLKTGANAAYDSKTGVSFMFTSGSVSDKKFILSNGSSVATFQEWVIKTGISTNASTVTGTNTATFELSEVIMGDAHFVSENTISDGTTVNDRMFQSMDNISHDYQLGTQFASTRALVEIPLFKDLFFEDTVKNVYPSPDNSLKLHFDTSLTAHTWNPSPVGRRYPSIPPADRGSYSAHFDNIIKDKNLSHSSIIQWEYIPTVFEITTPGSGYTADADATVTGGSGTDMLLEITSVGGSNAITGVIVKTVGLGFVEGESITVVQTGGSSGALKIITLGHYRVYVNNPKMFPDTVITPTGYYNVDGVDIYRQAFLSSGHWFIYSNSPTTDGYLKIHDNPSFFHKDFLAKIEVGMAVFVGGGYNSETLIPLTGDSLNPASAFENRNEYYHDAASVKTQGGNVDYGLRQYASAVEFKAGPTTNPHIPKTENKRARGIIQAIHPATGLGNYGIAILAMSPEDAEKFPNITPDLDRNSHLQFAIGEPHYLLTATSPNGSAQRLIYLGEASKVIFPHLSGTPTSNDGLVGILVAYPTYTGGTVPPIFDKANTGWYLGGQEILLERKGYDIEFIEGDKTHRSLENNLNISHTGRAAQGNSHWEFLVINTAAPTQLTIRKGPNTDIEPCLVQQDSLGLAMNIGDHLYVEHFLNTTQKVFYLGQIAQIQEGMVYQGSITAKTRNSESLITLVAPIDLAGAMYAEILAAQVAAAADYTDWSVAGGAPGNPHHRMYMRIGCHDVMKNDDEAILNRKWLYPYSAGGFRKGDTIWANMTYNNPHAMQGMFCKSRGIFNETLVWKDFNGGEGLLTTKPRSSIPIENFLIGNTCLETAQNYTQHVNKTIELNYANLGLNNPPIVAYIDPYLCNEEHARVLLYDVVHDREFVAFQDLYMQVQTSDKTPEIGWNREFTSWNYVDGTDNIELVRHGVNITGSKPNAFMTQIDVPNGYPTQNKYLNPTARSNFIEGAYAHNLANQMAGDIQSPVKGIITSLADLGSRMWSHKRGSGYNPAGTLSNLPTSGGFGSGLTVTITVNSAGKLSTIPTVFGTSNGIGYRHGDIIKVNQSGSGAGTPGHNAEFKVATTASNLVANLHTNTQSVKYGKGHGHFVHTGYYTGGILASERAIGDSILPRVADASVLPYWANKKHEITRKTFSTIQNFRRTFSEYRGTLPSTLTLQSGGGGYEARLEDKATAVTGVAGIMYGARTTSNGKGSGMLLDVTINGSGVITAGDFRRGGRNLQQQFAAQGYKDGDLIYVEDRTVWSSGTGASNMGSPSPKAVFVYHDAATNREICTTFDTPDGTRVIPAFLASKGIRAKQVDLDNMTGETRMNRLPHWTNMDFTRRLTIDTGEVALKDGITNIEAAAHEVVRLINQAGARDGRTHARRPNQDYPGESKLLNLNTIGTANLDDSNDPSAPHINADFAATGSTHDPAVWWDIEKAFNSYDKGTHMGYIRAHIGRVVQDINGNEGYSIVVHSTVPGATGRNFCVWLDNSKGQTTYQPEFLIGHGGRFRTFWCQPDEMGGENMHPAPMPLNKHGRPFAPITSLKQYTHPSQSIQEVRSVGDFAPTGDITSNPKLRAVSMMSGSGQNMNTINTESLEAQGFISSYTEGLRVGTSAIGRINFGGLVATGIPGFAPDAGIWGFGRKGDKRFNSFYGKSLDITDVSVNDLPTAYTGHVPASQVYMENIGNSNLYGLRLTDHRNKTHGIRFIYRAFGEKFALDNTELPQTIEDEIIVHFNDKDSSQGGFTIGKHLQGVGDASYGFPSDPENATLVGWRGNRWNCVPSISAAYDCRVTYNSTAKTLEMVFQAPYNLTCPHIDVLGYMGFPKTNGVVQVSDAMNDIGEFNITAGGSGFVNDLYYNQDIVAVSANGTGMKVNYTVAGGAVSAITIVDLGNQLYENGDTFQLVTPAPGANATFTLRYMLRGKFGAMFSYEGRTEYAGALTGTQVHTFHNVVGDAFQTTHKTNHASNFTAVIGPTSGTTDVSYEFGDSSITILGLISSPANWTCLITDELIAAVTDYTINLSDVNRIDGYTFDCRDMYASDGRTFAEWGVSADAIKIRAYNPERKIKPLSDFFTSKRFRDIGIKASHLEYGEPASVANRLDGSPLIGGANRCVVDSLLDDGRQVSCGYIPKTILQISTKSKGSNANTATPILVDSQNNIVDVSAWRRNLIGEDFVAISGDKILPACENHTFVGQYKHWRDNYRLLYVGDWIGLNPSTSTIWHFARPLGLSTDTPAHGGHQFTRVYGFGNRVPITWEGETAIAYGGAGSNTPAGSIESLMVVDKDTVSENWPVTEISGVFQKYADNRAYLFAGKRSLGSIHSEPIVYFRGARDSPDNYVPLFFGGGFSGATIDINDGTQNDYAALNTHPYANGPTGCAGIQHANEILSSFSTLDCNAIMAFFPGTSFLNQHRGTINPPMFNRENILSPNLTNAQNTPHNHHPYASVYTAGVFMQKPTPMVLRFAHPTARYQDHRTNTENKTTYLIYGPGQAFPITKDAAAPLNAYEPHPGATLVVGNTFTSVPHGGATPFLPNHIENDQQHYMPMTSAYQLARHRFHYRRTMNWTSAVGTPNVALLGQRPESGNNYGEQFASAYVIINPNLAAVTAVDAQEFRRAHPNRHAFFMGRGQVRCADSCFHMDDGYHPGGSWMDNQLTFNPPHPADNSRVVSESTFGGKAFSLHPTAFRVAGLMAKKLLYGQAGPAWDTAAITAADVDEDYVVVDATRCQNGEELACLLGAAINTFPGKGALKSLGGTFMPSMGNAMRQDRYGWISATVASFAQTSASAFLDPASIPGILPVRDGDAQTKFGGTAGANGYNNILLSGVSAGAAAAATSVLSVADAKWGDAYVDVIVPGVGLDDATGTDPLTNFIPDSGWLRTKSIHTCNITGSATTTVPAFAPYHARIKWKSQSTGLIVVRFFLSPNRISGKYCFESAETFIDSIHNAGSHGSMNIPNAITPTTEIYIWSKAGVHRFNNAPVADTSRDHMCHVHFNGLVDAIDRTKPIGVAGWHGERYSYLNSLGIDQDGNRVYSGGLGGWHSALGFSPYGGSISCANIFGNYAHITPMPSSPESVPPTNASGSSKATFFDDMPSEESADDVYHMHGVSDTYPEYGSYVVGYADGGQLHSPPIARSEPEIRKELLSAQGTYARSFLVVAYEGELALVAKKDRDGITCIGDYLKVGQTRTDPQAGTTQWDERFHNQDRFVCTANAGPNIEALIAQATVAADPSINYATADSLEGAPFNAEMFFHGAMSADTQLENATPCRAETGDLFFDYDKNIGGIQLENSINLMRRNVPSNEEYISHDTISPSTSFFGAAGAGGIQRNTFWLGDVHAQNLRRKAPAKNFSIENIVWKRMDGGSLTLPASNARGLGAIPWIGRVSDGTTYLMGEKIYGNVRFSFETTNSAMMPILQAQEISHPQLAEKHPIEMRNILNIPNEDIQFEDITVVDDTGQTHTLEGGSPLGVIIRGFKGAGERNASGLQPSVANTGLAPNLEIQLPDPDSIPGNILVRSGFDRIQAYQNETIGDGGMIHPDLDAGDLSHLFNNVVKSPRYGPTLNEVGWEHISKDKNFPDSSRDNWIETTNNNPLTSSYEQHDRTLYFHITKMGNSHTECYPTIYSHANGVENQALTVSSYASGTLTVSTAVNKRIFDPGVAITATITITDFTQLNTGDKVNLIATDGTNYDFSQGVQSSVNGTFEATTSNNQTATNLMNVINTSSGPSGTRFTATVNGAVVTATQAITGADGNTIVTLTDSGPAGMTKTNFIGGIYPTFGSKEVSDNRGFLRIVNSSGDSVIVSYTGISGDTFTGVIGDIDFAQFLVDNPPSTTTLNISPSYYIPAGSARLFAARRLRDHAEVSGNSPDMAHTQYFDGDANTFLHTRYSAPKLTPLPYPRMGHHYVNATMPMMPGHWAHPAYQGIYDKHRDEYRASLRDQDWDSFYDNLENLADGSDALNTQHALTNNVKARISPLNPYLRVGTLTATPSGPSDIHGGGFTLMFESKIRHDGYGILASKGEAGNMNKTGGHSIVLEANANYTLDNHFPDPAEVGAYQIVIQPNLHSQQIAGFHLNNASATGFPDIATPANNTAILTNQQVNLVVGIKYDSERGGSVKVGGATLILAEATMADIRGCEIFINEIMLDHDPDHMGQFTNIPPLSVFNPFGVQGSESPSLTRVGHPYHYGMFIDSTPGYTLNIPWWSIMHKIAPDDSTSTGFKHLSIYRIDNFYEFCRGTHGSIAAQITLGGYPSIYPNIYSRVLGNTSLTPTCVTQSGSTTTTINVDDASLFPEKPYYGQKLLYISPTTGEEVAIDYTIRVGTSHASGTMNQYHQIIIPAIASAVPTGVTLRLSRTYSEEYNSRLLTHSPSSVLTRTMPQLLSGTRDTNSLFVGDAFICAWHPNLGRPHTFYSDGSRTWGNHTSDRAVNNEAHNHIPEHYETIHYHDVHYGASLGPLTFGMMTPTPNTWVGSTYQSGVASGVGTIWNITTSASVVPSTVTVNDFIYAEGRLVGKVATIATAVIGITVPPFYTPSVGAKIYFFNPTATNLQVSTGGEIHAMNGYEAQGSVSTMLTHFWPCGSRGGPLISRLDGFATMMAGWHRPRLYEANAGTYWTDADDDGTGTPKYVLSSGLSTVAASSIATRSYPFGYRFGLRQTWNRPQWGHYGMRAFEEKTLHAGASNVAVGYKAGPLTNYKSQDWNYAGGGGLANTTLPETYVGILERQTNAAGMLNTDKYENQVRYAEGVRMTRPFGCPLRTLRNASTVIRDWWGDDDGKGIGTLEGHIPYYIVDWWGNTRGEDVRKPPVRGFGVRPAWDAGDAYEYDRASGLTPYQRIWNGGKPLYNVKGVLNASGEVSVSGTTIPRFGGRLNNVNNNSTITLVDVFCPTNALRVGDMGNGRGVRFPAQFNEDRLVELNAVYENAGVVLSHNTAEPTFGNGYIRPRNEVRQPDEILQGISNRLEIDEDGLLKPEGVVSERVETITGTSVHKEAVSRSSPRIGIDGESLESYGQGINRNMIAINSEAHSLHTDKGVGQRIVLHGGMVSGSQSLIDYDLTSLSFAAQPHGGIMRFSHTNNMKSYGGNYIMETRSYVNPFNDTGWGRGAKLTGTQKTSNPYENEVYGSNIQTNYTDKDVKFLLKPVRVLDNKHVEVFRPMSALHSSSPQYQANYYSATAGGKYGLFSYEVGNGRATEHGGSTTYSRTTNPNANAPYQPVYLVESSSDTVPTAKGPKLLGTEVTGYDKTSLKSPVTRLIISENTLQHFRADASRRNMNKKDYNIKPRFSQSLHSKGHKEDVSFNTSSHIGDA